MTIQLHTTKGSPLLTSYADAAMWLIRMQPSHVSIGASSDVEWSGDEHVTDLTRALILAHLSEDEGALLSLRAEAGAAGDGEMVALCTRALDGDDSAYPTIVEAVYQGQPEVG